jgi:amino-acid N-acetyltransferase
MDFQAEPTRPQDLAGALELLRATGLPETGVAERFSLYRVVRDTGRVVGLGGLEIHGEDGLLRSLAVADAYRGQGIARRLVEAILDLAGHNALRHVYLLTTDAKRYFEKHGFVEVTRDVAPDAIRDSWEFRTGCPASSTLMQRPVSTDAPAAS